MIRLRHNSSFGRVLVTLLFVVGVFGLTALPSWAETEHGAVCGDDARVGEVHTPPAGFNHDDAEKPIPDFCVDIDDACGELQASFTDLSVGYIDTWEWDFGDPNSGSDNYSNEENPTHFYGTSGVYTVTLTVTGPGGSASKTRTDVIIVRTEPIADFIALSLRECVNTEICFEDRSTFATWWRWDFGDGSAYSYVENPCHTYTTPGTYTVTLKVRNQCGHDEEIKEVYITIDGPPTVDFTADPTEMCLDSGAVTFTDMSVDADSWFWDFGDGNTSADQNPVHTYATAGLYTVTLTAANECGDASATKVEYINVNDGPTADFTSDTQLFCVGSEVCFQDLSVDADWWRWDFGDGSGYVWEHEPCHTYTTAGTYTVELAVRNECGVDKEVKELFITVVDQPVADFTSDVTESCVGVDVQFTDLSQNAATWSWSFGDGATATDQNPLHSYTVAGVYAVTLTVTNACGDDTETKTEYITVGTSPIADFAADPTVFCEESTVDFTDLSQFAETWLWDFGDGNTSPDQNPSHTYAATGTYTVTLTVTNRCGEDSITKEAFILIGQPPIADFTSDVTETCVGADVQFTDLSQHADTWTWDFGDGTTSILQNPTHSYATAGVYAVTLTVTNACGEDSETKAEYITVGRGPIADFTSDETVLCEPGPVHFTDLSQDADSWLWEFGDGNTSTEQNPAHAYAGVGAYTVTLTVANECGEDFITKEAFILVGQYPIADFSADPTETCVGATVTFTDMSQYATTWLWDFGDGNSSPAQHPTHVYAQPGYYDVTLRVTNVCGDDEEFKAQYIFVRPTPQADFTVADHEGCAPSGFQFTDLSLNAETWLWDFGDGATSDEQNPLHTYTASGVYDVRLTVSNPCGEDTEFKPGLITIYVAPTADFEADVTETCIGSPVRFTDLSVDADSWEWSFGDGATSISQNPSHSYSSDGLYTVTLRAINRCGDDIEEKTAYISVGPWPLPGFMSDVTEGCGPLTVSFTQQSYDVDDWHWDFGDGAVSDDEHPTHIYTTPGTYTVTLTVSNICGSRDDEKLDFITVLPGPAADYSTNTTESCVGDPVEFYDHSTHADTWEWDFGDGNTSTDQNPVHTYSAVGRYDVTLTVTNDCGGDSEYRSEYISVGIEPIADFTADQTSGCAGMTVNFTDLSTNADTYSWDFGDGSTSSAASPSHTYNAAGVYSVRLLVSNACGDDYDERMAYIRVYGPPTADFEIHDPFVWCAPLPIDFIDRSTDAESWLWDFGDGNTSTDQNPTHTYQNAGTYDVTLTVTNDCGPDTEPKTAFIRVDEEPTADFIASNTDACVNQPVSFTNQSTNGRAYTWDFGDGNTSHDDNPTHTYAVAGTYTVTLTAGNLCGSDIEVKDSYVTVNPGPTADFSADKTSGCGPLEVAFTDLSVGALTWSWDFGDGGNSSVQSPSHTYTTPGLYSVSLTVTNACGPDEAYRMAYIYVYEDPIADFSSDQTASCEGVLVEFTDLSTDAMSWAWDFGDGATSDVQNPDHSYDTQGTYTVRLIVTNDCGADTTTGEELIAFTPPPVADFSADPTATCTGSDVDFTDLSTGAYTWQWDFGDGATSDVQNPTHSYTVAGTYTISLTVTNECGNDTETKAQYVTVQSGPTADFSATPLSGAAPLNVTFTDLSTSLLGITSWTWAFGDGGTSSAQNPTHMYSDTGHYTVTLTVVDACGDDEETKEAYVYVTGDCTVEFNWENDGVCLQSTYYFNAYAVGECNVTAWDWDFGDGDTGSGQYPEHAYTASGSYVVTLSATNDGETLTAVKTVSVTVYPGPTAEFSAAPTSGEAPLDVTFTDLSTSVLGIDTWAWQFGDGDISSDQNPTHAYNSPGTYNVVLTVTDSCGTDYKVKQAYVHVGGECEVDFNWETSSFCDSTTYYFYAFPTGNCDISSYEWDFGDGSSGSGQNTEHTYTASGTYTVTLMAFDYSGTVEVYKDVKVEVFDGPTADFYASPYSGGVPLIVNFTDISFGSQAITSWEWDFGDPTSGSDNTSSDQNPMHTFNVAGVYTVSLTVTDECGVDTRTGTITAGNQPAPITINKSVDKDSAIVNDELEYTMVVRNVTETPVYNLVVTDTVPDYASYIQNTASNGGLHDAGLDVVSWNFQMLNPGAELTLSFRVVLDGPFTSFPTTVSNFAVASIAEEALAKQVEARTFISNTVETRVYQGTPTGQLSIVKNVDATLASPGDPLTYTLTVSNPNPEAASGVVVADEVPDYTEYAAGSISAGGTYDAGTDSLHWNLGNMAAFETREVSFVVMIDPTVSDGQRIPNIALVRSVYPGGSEIDSAVTTVSALPMVIKKEASKPSGMIGDLIKFTVTIENFSAATLDDVILVDTMPHGLFPIDGTSLLNGASIDDPTGDNPYEWSLTDLPASGTFTVEYTALVGVSASVGRQVNVARSRATQGGLAVHSNRATAEIYVLGSTLSGSIRGKVVVDCDGDGIADMDEGPVGMDVFLDDGSQSKVNNKGMFYFSTVRAGERVVALDERDLDGYYIPEGAQSSVFAHVHETGESYIIFRVCPEYPQLDIMKKASIVPAVKVTKTAKVHPEQAVDSLGVLMDYQIDITSNGLADPTQIRVVDSFPVDTRVILDESQTLKPTKNGTQLVYEITAAQERLQKSVYYSLKDLTPGVRRFLSNKVHLEGDVVDAGNAAPEVSAPAEVAAGPFLLAPPQDVNVTLTPALFITSMDDLQEPAIPQLHAVADSILKYADAKIKVNGHTDYRPIHTEKFPSNWELGEGRAKAVVNWLVENRGIERDRLAYESFAATVPVVTSGTTSEELQPNRRTEVIIEARVAGFLAPSVAPDAEWTNSTTLALNPVKFDTLFEPSAMPIEIDIDDSWEVVLTVENTSAMAAENAVLTDVLPEGVEYLDNSATIDGKSIAATAAGSTLSLTLPTIDPDQKLELRYRIRAIDGTTPSGGGAASIEVQTSQDLPVVQTSNEVRFQ